MQQGDNNNNQEVDNNQQQQQQVLYATTLVANPKNLFQLWHKYKFGIDGRKAAKDFSAIEQGQNKFKMCRRKAFWDVFAKLVRAGMMAEVAIDQVYITYGRKECVTNILKMMIQGQKKQR